MAARSLFHFRYPAEVLLLVSLAIALPMFEAPKNILWGAWLAVWLVARWKEGDWGGGWNIWDTLITTWLVSVLLSAIFAGATHNEWNACRDVIRYTSILWLLSRSNYSESAWKVIYVALAISVIVASIWAMLALAWPHKYLGIQLNSVGHVNHSVIYIVICFGGLLGGLATYWPSLPPQWRAGGIAGLAVLLTAVCFSGSRAAAVTVMLQALGLGVLWLRRSPRLLLVASVSVVAFAAMIIGFDTEIWRKQEFVAESPHPVLGARYQIWNQALVEWRMHPVFGIGNSNFGQAQETDVQGWLTLRGENYSDTTYAVSSHAHSLYLNTLAERGVVGFTSLVVLLIAFAISLLRGLPRPDDEALHWLLWSGAASAFLTIAGIGLVNTTMHNEPALLAMLLLGGWVGYRRRQRFGIATIKSQAAPVTQSRFEVASGSSD
ncbi:MAG TPA: O-antigen ligase family protein [Terriglobales bacterium]|nr:O-antigen ligase family protein [Terriglobales bacterium]